ncbi:hypothetical protein ACFQ3N_15145 [Virgibacillus byunsanensis]|uniref:Uncharacterized protein n=1 Tax=Virgibacillus byunsanensis TaxID=570945 RepID=A0ABW3LMZ6_9BACI
MDKIITDSEMEKVYMEKFKTKGALSEDTAKTLKEIDCTEGMTFWKLKAKGIFIKVGEDRYYMDAKKAYKYRTNYTKTGNIIALTVILIFIVYVYTLLTN